MTSEEVPGQPEFHEMERLVLTLDTGKLNFIQYPEFSLGRRRLFRRKARSLAGDWDQVRHLPLFWSSVYEPELTDGIGMVPLENYQFYRALEDRFVRNLDWQETSWYGWLISQLDRVPVKRYGTPESIAARLEMLEQIYESYRAENVKIASSSGLVVNLGRDGRISIEDGRHRLCIAKIAGLSEVSVSVCVIHASVAAEASTL